MTYRLFHRFFLLVFCLCLVGCIVGLITFTIIHVDPFESFVFDIYQKKNIVYFDRFGKNMTKMINETHNSYIPFNKISPHVVQAFLAAEDAKFFDHNGISFSGILRSAIVNILRGKYVQGASTITQQMIKLHFNDSKKTLYRKIKEQIYALLVELHHSKEEIFERYINILYFGRGIYGLNNASMIFWNKNVADISIAQAAGLAGIIQRPEKFNPYKNFDQFLRRRNVILKRMYNNKYITKKEYLDALQENITVYSYNRQSFLENLDSLYGQFFMKDINKNKQKIFVYTTIDYDIQKKAYLLFEEYIKKWRETIPELQGACVILNNKTNEVVAYINGVELYKNLFPRILYERQTGSIIKPLIAYYAFLQGDTPQSIYIDEPFTEIAGWNPQNVNKKFKGPMTLEKALISSNNIIPIKILDKYGVSGFTSLLKRFFPNKEIPDYLSNALGTIECSALEMAYIMSCLKNKGVAALPCYLHCIQNEHREIIFRQDAIQRVQLLEVNIVQDVNKILKRIGVQLCNRLSSEIPQGFMAKTGTTNKAKSCWFMGASDAYTIVTWFGTDDQSDLSQYSMSSVQTAAKYSLEMLNMIA